MQPEAAFYALQVFLCQCGASRTVAGQGIHAERLCIGS